MVEKAEADCGHRICGAAIGENEPCQLESDHPNGRCRYHGGTAVTGAPPGNQNARVHGLYQHRLQTCGPHCLHWSTCPLAGDDVLALKPGARPKCPYEQAEYDTLLQALFHCSLEDLESPDADIPSSGANAHDLHQIIMLQIMLSRAASALANYQLMETIAGPHGTTTKTSAAFEAFIRTAREYRQLRFPG